MNYNFVLFPLKSISPYFEEEEKWDFFLQGVLKNKHFDQNLSCLLLPSEKNSLDHKMFILKLYIVLAFLINSGPLCNATIMKSWHIFMVSIKKEEIEFNFPPSFFCAILWLLFVSHSKD